MEANQRRRSSSEVREEYLNFLRFAIDKANNFDLPFSVYNLCRVFKEETGTLSSIANIKQNVLKCRSNIYKLEEFDKNTKIKLMFALSASVNEEFLEKLQKEADVMELDEKQRIIKYKSKEGSLILEGNHNTTAKIVATRSERKRRLEISKLNEMEEEEDHEETMETERKKTNRRSSISERRPNRRSGQSNTVVSNESEIIDGVDPLGEDLEEHWNGDEIAQNAPTNLPTLPSVFKYSSSTFDRKNTTLIDSALQNMQVKTEQQADLMYAPSNSEERNGYTSHQKVLESLQTLFLTLDIKPLAALIGVKMDKAKRANEMVSILGIKVALEAFLHMVKNGARIGLARDDESIDLIQFLLLLTQTVVGLRLPVLRELEHELRETKLDTDMRVPVNWFEYVLEPALRIISTSISSRN